jgi:hypothetical protein
MARLLPRFSSNDSPGSHWIHRVTDNFRAALLLPKYVRSSSNGAFTLPGFARFFSF